MARRVVKKVVSGVKKAAKATTRGVKKAARAVTGKASGTSKKAAGATSKRSASAKPPKPAKRAGDVLGVSSARVPKSVPRATKDRGGNPQGIEIGPQARGSAFLKPLRTRG